MNLKESVIGHAAAHLLGAVMQKMVEGADSGVGPPSNTITRAQNFFKDPEDCIRMVDALVTESREGIWLVP